MSDPRQALPEPVRAALADPGRFLSWDAETRWACWRALPGVGEPPGDLAVELVPLLIAALGAPEQGIRHHASYLLRSITGEDHGYRAWESAERRVAAQRRWGKWWVASSAGFTSRLPAIEGATLIVDEIPGRIVGDDDEPPGRLLLLDREGRAVVDIQTLKMPYDAAKTASGDFLVNIIRARAVWTVTPGGVVTSRMPVGGYPCSLQLLENGNLLVAGWDDDVPGFVREFDQSGRVVWSVEPLRWPWKAERLPSGGTLIADAGTNRVFELDPQGHEVWAVDGLGPETPELFDALGPIYCQRLPDGNTLISVRGLSRIVEVDPAGNVVWEVGDELVSNQYSAVRLWNGNTLIADAGHLRVIEIDHDLNVVWEYGGLGYPAKAYRL